MKKWIFPLLVLLTAGCRDNTGYDADLARDLGADTNGMKRYIIAFLKEGPHRDQSPPEMARIQEGHYAAIRRWSEAGKLVLAGPFLDDSDLKGIFIFNLSSLSATKALAEEDPAITSGRLTLDLHPWFGSAGLMELPALHSRLVQPQ
ncbi:MAG: YciI family protein [Fidelibacterota bacterium]